MTQVASRSTWPAAVRKPTLADITTKARNLPSRIIMHGVPGIGKTSFPAYDANPVYVMSRLENGIETLRDAGLVPDNVGSFPECQTWGHLLQTLEVLLESEHTYKSLVLDTINGAERMCHEAVCGRDYNDRFAAFAAYQAGYKVSVADWRQLLALLDKIREEKRMRIFLLAHTKIKNYKNPEGPDFDRYTPDLNEETWSVTHGWADLVLFANYEVRVKREGSKNKGSGGENRFLYTTRTAAWDAKQRHGLPDVISMGTSGKEAWANFLAAFPKKEGAK